MSQLPLTKVCSVCKVEKPLEDFSKDKRKPSGRRCCCRQCDSAQCKKYRVLHHNEVLERERIRQEALKQITRRKRSEAGPHVPAKMRPEYPEKVRVWMAQWRASHRLERCQSKAERRALKKALTVERVSYKEIWERDKGICYLCGNPVQWEDHHFDHVIPLSRGGPHSKDNIRVTHAKCNLKKGNRIIDGCPKV